MTPKMIDQYKTHLENEDLSTLTITGYLANTRPFLQWFEQSNSDIQLAYLPPPTRTIWNVLSRNSNN
jgi:hypothetical protein